MQLRRSGAFLARFTVFGRLAAGFASVMVASSVWAADPPKAADPAAEQRAKLVAAHLAAGEFGSALTLASSTAGAAERAVLLQSVTQSQQQGSGNPSTSTPGGSGQGSGGGATSGRGSFGGGGVIADFSTLMQLIQTNTDAKWKDVDGEGGTMSPFPTGVRVAPNGIVQRQSKEELTGTLAALGVRARKADLNADVARPADLRLVSLTRLEQAISQRISDGLPVPETMAQLAGLTQVKYIFTYPDSNEIVLGGPADGWQYNDKGQPVSSTSNRPTLQLDDLVTVLRTFAKGEPDFGCSINTRDAGVRALTDYVQKSQSRGPLNAGAVRSWTNILQEKLGRQDIVVWGVPADSRVARVLVEADYRMKLIGIDKLDAGKEIPSYFDLLPPAQQKNASMDALRWWLSVKCDAISHSTDKLVYEIQGSAVLCQSENQQLTAEGKHLPTGKAEATNQLFAQNFTANYDKLSARDPIFADAHNIFSLALVSALIQQHNLDDRVQWNMGAFAPHGAYATAHYAAPKEVDSVVNHRVYNGKDIVVQVAGGVRADVMALVKDKNLNHESPKLNDVSKTAKAPDLPQGRWWWDAAK